MKDLITAFLLIPLLTLSTIAETNEWIESPIDHPYTITVKTNKYSQRYYIVPTTNDSESYAYHFIGSFGRSFYAQDTNIEDVVKYPVGNWWTMIIPGSSFPPDYPRYEYTYNMEVRTNNTIECSEFVYYKEYKEEKPKPDSAQRKIGTWEKIDDTKYKIKFVKHLILKEK